MALALLCSTPCACGGPRGGPASVPATNAVAVSDLLPSDLDIVVRIDWPTLRQSPLYSQIRGAISGKGLDRLDRLGPVLDDARAVLVGLRIMSDGVHGDGVLVIEGENTSIDPNDVLLVDRGVRFRRLPDLRGMLVFERQGDLERGDAALVAIVPHRGIVIATLAEVDALRRTMHSRADADRLEPPARGLVSFAGRVRQRPDALLSGPGGRFLRRISDGLTGLSGSADLSGGRALALEADLEYASVSSAEAGHDALRAAGTALESLGPRLRAVLRSVEVSRHDQLVTVRASISMSPVAGSP
jgi:hypothetical protein